MKAYRNSENLLRRLFRTVECICLEPLSRISEKRVAQNIMIIDYNIVLHFRLFVLLFVI